MIFQTEICTDVNVLGFKLKEVMADVEIKLSLKTDLGSPYIDEIEDIAFLDCNNFEDLSEEYEIDKNILIPILIASIVNQLDDGRIDILDDVVDSARVAYYDDLAGRIFNDY